MITCVYCQKSIEPESAIVTEVGTACNDCAVRPEPEQSSHSQAQSQSPSTDQIENESASESPFNLMRAFRELQWIRLKQCAEGETDSVVMKRSLAEIIIMMEKELHIAKEAVTQLHPEATLNARYHTLSAVCLGLAYLSNHPGPA